jgi:ribonuclease VapC
VIVDTSVMVALLIHEPEEPRFVLELDQAPRRLISAGSWIELSTAIARRFDAEMFDRADLIMSTLGIELAAVTANQASIGRDAYRRFGRASGSRARLNFGDCFSYALAKDLDEPLLFKGEDFIHTDVKQAIPR